MTKSPAPPGELAIRIVLPLLVAGWLVGTLGLLFAAVITAAPFFGEQPDATETAAAAHLRYGAAAVALVVPLVGLALAARLRSRGWVGTWVTVLVLGAVLALWLGADAYRQRPTPPPPAPHVGCQERSGGDTDCPGG